TPSPLRSSSSAISAKPRPRSMICAICSRSMSRRAAISGRWSISCRNILAVGGGGGGRFFGPPLRRWGFTAHAGRLQRGDAGLAVVLHVHLLHRSRRKDATALAGAVRLRSAVAHLPLHADRRGASPVRRRDRPHPRGAADVRSQ